MDGQTVKVLWLDNPDNKKQIKIYTRGKLEEIHKIWPGGEDILTLL